MVLYYPLLNSTPRIYDTRNFFANAAGVHLFLNERDSDVAICVEWDGNDWHFPAHRLVLTAMSEVFRHMFDIDMSEKKLGKVTINDYGPFTVKQFLKYLYMGALDLKCWTDALDLMKIAHKYGVQTLVLLCESYLCTSITFANSCCLYETACTYTLENLLKQASTFILDAAFIVTSTEGFLSLKSNALDYFLYSTHLNMENECCVLTTLREWALFSCSRRGLRLTKDNVLNEMKPFMKYIKWALIPEQLRTFVPDEIVEEHIRETGRRRKSFHVAASLQYHMHIVKFIVELDAFYEDKTSDAFGLNCLKFGVDNHAFVTGFKIIAMFKVQSFPNMNKSSLTLGRDDNKLCTVFNLNSLPWSKGTTVGDYVWRELIAYLPYPVRVDPFSTYVISLRMNSSRDSVNAKWPYTRLESGVINSSVGTVNFHCCSECYGITQLFMLPAPSVRNINNDDF